MYRKRMSDEEVREELLKRAGTQFDPALTWNRMLETFKEYVGEHDVNIRYTNSLNVIALFDRSDEETMAVKDAMRANCPTIVITDLK